MFNQMQLHNSWYNTCSRFGSGGQMELGTADLWTDWKPTKCQIWPPTRAYWTRMRSRWTKRASGTTCKLAGTYPQKCDGCEDNFTALELLSLPNIIDPIHHQHCCLFNVTALKLLSLSNNMDPIHYQHCRLLVNF